MEAIVQAEESAKIGKMKKSPLIMSVGELKRWKKSMDEDIRTYLFSIGQPLVYRKEGRMVAEYADGKVELI